MKKIYDFLNAKFKANTPLWAKNIRAFCIMLAPLLISYNTGIDIVEKYKYSGVIILNVLAFIMSFLAKDENVS